MRLVLAAAIALLLTSCAASDWPPRQLPDQISPAVVALVTPEGRAYCSGTATTRGILTAAHCTDGNDFVFFAELGSYDASLNRWTRMKRGRVIFSNREYDVALVEASFAYTLPLALEDPVPGTQVVSVGHPLGYGYTLARGYVSRATACSASNNRPDCFMFVDMTIIPGMSGSSVVDGNGQIVGVVSFLAQLSAGSPLAGVVPISTVLEVLHYEQAF